MCRALICRVAHAASAAWGVSLFGSVEECDNGLIKFHGMHKTVLFSCTHDCMCTQFGRILMQAGLKGNGAGNWQNAELSRLVQALVHASKVSYMYLQHFHWAGHVANQHVACHADCMQLAHAVLQNLADCCPSGPAAGTHSQIRHLVTFDDCGYCCTALLLQYVALMRPDVLLLVSRNVNDAGQGASEDVGPLQDVSPDKNECMSAWLSRAAVLWFDFF